MGKACVVQEQEDRVQTASTQVKAQWSGQPVCNLRTQEEETGLLQAAYIV